MWPWRVRKGQKLLCSEISSSRFLCSFLGLKSGQYGIRVVGLSGIVEKTPLRSSDYEEALAYNTRCDC